MVLEMHSSTQEHASELVQLWANEHGSVQVHAGLIELGVTDTDPVDVMHGRQLDGLAGGATGEDDDDTGPLRIDEGAGTEDEQEVDAIEIPSFDHKFDLCGYKP